jgi:hypothetical protein
MYAERISAKKAVRMSIFTIFEEDDNSDSERLSSDGRND